jgi:hypothetical protein
MGVILGPKLLAIRVIEAAENQGDRRCVVDGAERTAANRTEGATGFFRRAPECGKGVRIFV